MGIFPCCLDSILVPLVVGIVNLVAFVFAVVVFLGIVIKENSVFIFFLVTVCLANGSSSYFGKEY
jgi:hypothetical protein